MKSLANASALALALLWLIAGACTPKPVVQETTKAATEAAAIVPILSDTTLQAPHISESVSGQGPGREGILPQEKKANQPDLPPDAGTEPDEPQPELKPSAVAFNHTPTAQAAKPRAAASIPASYGNRRFRIFRRR